jgi:hypothetical protein
MRWHSLLVGLQLVYLFLQWRHVRLEYRHLKILGLFPTMGFKELAAFLRVGNIQACSGICVTNKGLLGVVVRHCDARCTSVLVDSGLPDDTFNLIAVFQSLAQSFEDYRTHCLLEEQLY